MQKDIWSERTLPAEADALTPDDQRGGDGRLSGRVSGQAGVRSRVAMGHVPDQQVAGARPHRLSAELTVHRQLLAVECPRDRQRSVPLEDVTSEGDVVASVQSLFSSVNGQLWWHCNSTTKERTCQGRSPKVMPGKKSYLT